MTWFKVDDGFHDHPKVGALLDGEHGYSALSLWLLAGAWCAKQLTDGHVPSGRVFRLGCPPEAAQELVRVGLWKTVEGGYRFHDWGKYQPTKMQINQARTDCNARVTRYRVKQRNALLTHNHGPSARDPDPTRPDPINSPDGESSESPPAADDVRRVFDHWVKTFWMGRGQRPKLDDKRRKRIQARLKTFTADQLCEAISGASTGWHRDNGHTGIQTLLRDDEAVEKHMGVLAGNVAKSAEKPEPVKLSVPQAFEEFKRHDMWLSNYDFERSQCRNDEEKIEKLDEERIRRSKRMTELRPMAEQYMANGKFFDSRQT